MNTIKLEITTPHGVIYEGDVKSVTLPGKEGEFGVLPGHASLVSLLNAGVIEFEKADGEKELVAINWGHVKVDEGKVSVLADGAVAITGKESDVAKELEKAKELIESMGDSNVAIASATAKLEGLSKGKF